MAKFGFGISVLRPAARHAAQMLSRPFRMMALPDDEAAGPGWYESSRELDQGLQVHEDFGGDAAIARWRELESQWQLLAQAAVAAAQRRVEVALAQRKGERAGEACDERKDDACDEGCAEACAERRGHEAGRFQRRCRTAAPSSITASA